MRWRRSCLRTSSSSSTDKLAGDKSPHFRAAVVEQRAFIRVAQPNKGCVMPKGKEEQSLTGRNPRKTSDLGSISQLCFYVPRALVRSSVSVHSLARSVQLRLAGWVVNSVRLAEFTRTSCSSVRSPQCSQHGLLNQIPTLRFSARI